MYSLIKSTHFKIFNLILKNCLNLKLIFQQQQQHELLPEIKYLKTKIKELEYQLLIKSKSKNKQLN